jgi:Fic family protein
MAGSRPALQAAHLPYLHVAPLCSRRHQPVCRQSSAGRRDDRGKPAPAPDGYLVAELLEELCDYVNDNWDRSTPIHLAAYILWRLNWIHPFDDGNGRTSRAVSYLVLCIRTGSRLPGENTIPEQIARNKKPYYEALEAADGAWKQGVIDVSRLEELLADLLAAQLAGIFEQATGRPA